uniref:Right handed beta helix domain-containing protein n=1 Tax=Panagrolaimus davidi TaxID=227884 RepID=A0A914QDB2_9BILA
MIVNLPRRLPYDYTLQFLSIINQNPNRIGSKSHLLICDAEDGLINSCSEKRYRIPIYDGVFPQSVSLRSSGNPIYIALEHELGPISTGRVFGDIELQFKLHASATHQAFYGLNVTHSVVVNNTGNGIQAQMIRDRTALWNVTVESNEGIGFYVKDGAADIWVNDTSLSHNWIDGMNVSYAGGSININGSRFIENRWRGFTFHQNMSLPFLPLRQEIIIKGRPSNNIFYPPTIFKGNFWGGIVIGNNCLPEIGHFYEPKVLINWVQFLQNHNHPAIDVFSCRDPQPAPMTLDITGNVFERNTEVTVRIQPAVNILGIINSNQFSYNNYSALLIKNSHHPQLKNLYADFTIAKNTFKFNKGPWIINIGLNEDAPNQKMIFNQQNEVTGNEVYNPFPFLKPRSTPYAALIVSSSNVIIDKNCFRNPQADYEIGTELMEHAKIIDARNNNWGYTKPDNFMHRIFDQFD